MNELTQTERSAQCLLANTITVGSYCSRHRIHSILECDSRVLERSIDLPEGWPHMSMRHVSVTGPARPATKI